MQEPNANAMPYHAMPVLQYPLRQSMRKASHVKTKYSRNSSKIRPVFISHVVTFDCLFRHLAKKLLDILYPLKLLLFVVHHAQGRRSAFNQISTVKPPDQTRKT